MFSSARMKKVDILVLAKDEHKVTEALGNLGAVHFVEVREVEQTTLLGKPEALDRLQRCAALLEKAANLSKRLGVTVDDTAVVEEHIPVDAIEDRLHAIEADVGHLIRQEDDLNARMVSLEGTMEQVGAFRRLNVPVEEIPAFSFLHFATGRMPDDKLDAFIREAGPAVVTVPLQEAEGQTRMVAVTTKKGRWALESTLEKYGFRPEALGELYQGLPEDIYRQAQADLAELEATREHLMSEYAVRRDRYADELSLYRRRLRVEQRLLGAEEHFGRTGATSLISGWVPERRLNDLSQSLANLTAGRVVIDSSDPMHGDTDVPILMHHGILMRPFQALVSNYGFPGYGEIEPTILVALTFLVMFGIMFGDVGQGAVLAIAGAVMLQKKWRPSVRSFGVILIAAGVAAMIGGWLFGSVFGYEGLIPPLWMHPMEGRNIITLLAWCIVLGVFMVSLGIVLNILNRLRRRDFSRAALDKFGLAGLWFYWGALWLIVRAITPDLEPASLAEILLLLLAPAMLVMFRQPILRLITHGRMGERGAEAAIESGMDIFEMLLAFLSSTVSFVRVGAFALAHVGLSLAIFTLVGMTGDTPAGWLIAALIIIFGNLIVLAIEGMIVSIQCVRLEYYEFFTKFFKGEGKPFSPFSLKTDS